MESKLATPVLIACTLFMSIIAGTGLYEHMFGIPKMLSSSAALMETTSGTQGQPEKFWIPLHALSLVTLVLSLVFNWKNHERKKWILIVLGGYIYISVVSIFFAKELFAFPEITDAAEFTRQTSRWLLLSWHRPVIGLASVVLLLISLSKPSPRIREVK